MTEFDALSIPWRPPWHAIDRDYALKAKEELRREMCDSHVLFGRDVAAIGYRQDCDDVLFYLGDAEPRLAVVHLTHQVEKDPRWPETSLFNTVDDWIRLSMVPEANGFAA